MDETVVISGIQKSLHDGERLCLRGLTARLRDLKGLPVDWNQQRVPLRTVSSFCDFSLDGQSEARMSIFGGIFKYTKHVVVGLPIQLADGRRFQFAFVKNI
jgi:hypothetical protein